MLLTKENRIFVKAVLIRKSYTSAICFQINIDLNKHNFKKFLYFSFDMLCRKHLVFIK